jgi:hypothetical protein
LNLDKSEHFLRGLLDLILDTNHLGLKVTEVEGDAVLFYKFGKAPELDITYNQVEKVPLEGKKCK